MLVTGLVLFIASVLTVPVLGAAGFEALGPAAGTAAASWQASLGLVEAGSLFAWCQIAAMGGAAVGGIQAVGATGLAIACTTWISVVNMSGLQGKFMRFSLTNKVIARDLSRAGVVRKQQVDQAIAHRGHHNCEPLIRVLLILLRILLLVCLLLVVLPLIRVLLSHLRYLLRVIQLKIQLLVYLLLL